MDGMCPINLRPLDIWYGDGGHLGRMLLFPLGSLCLYLFVGYSEVNFSRVSTREGTNEVDCERASIIIDL